MSDARAVPLRSAQMMGQQNANERDRSIIIIIIVIIIIISPSPETFPPLTLSLSVSPFLPLLFLSPVHVYRLFVKAVIGVVWSMPPTSRPYCSVLDVFWGLFRASFLLCLDCIRLWCNLQCSCLCQISGELLLSSVQSLGTM